MKVQKLQNFAAKVVDGKARKYDHVTPILKQLNWLNIPQQINFNIAVKVYKSLNNLYPEHLMHLPSVGSITNSSTRQINNLYKPKVKTHIGARSITVNGPNIYNKLPANIRTANNVFNFKKNLKDFLLNQV